MIDIEQSQEQLGRAIDRARAGEDRELSARVRDLGEQLVRQLFGALRMTRLHSLDNEAFERPVQDLSRTISQLEAILGAIHMVAVEGQVYVNDIRVRLDDRMDVGKQLTQEFRRHAVGGISFHDVPTPAQLRKFIECFAAAPDEAQPRHALTQALVAAGVDCVELMGVFRFRVTGERVMSRDADVGRITRRAVSLVDNTVDVLGANRMPNPLPIRRMITEILEVGPEAEGMWDEPDAGSTYSSHTLRITLYTIAIGRGLGLSQEALQDLGVAAMFHDIGYAAREGARPAGPNRPAEPGFAPPFERHPGSGARLLLRQRGFHEAKILRALSTLEHHRDFDDPRGTPTLVGRILRIAEAFDTLVRKRGGGMTPPQALASMLAHSGTRYDPDILQVAVNTLGRYPPGTYLLLEDGRIVRSESMTRGPDTFDKPMCVLVRTAQGGRPPAHTVVDLAVEGKVARVVRPR